MSLPEPSPPFDLEETLALLLDLCRPRLGFDEACVLRRGDGDALKVECATLPAFVSTRWPRGPMAAAAQAGAPVHADTLLLPGTEAPARFEVARVHDLSDAEQEAYLVCLHRHRGSHGPEQTSAAGRFSPLFSRALRAADAITVERQANRRTIDKHEETASRMAALIQHMRAGVLVEDAEGRVALANQAFCACFAVPAPPEALKGALCADLAQAAVPLLLDPQGFAEGVQRNLQRRTPAIAERIELKDGRVLERDYLPITQGGRYMGTLWQYQDITDRIHAQDNLREAKNQAEAASAAKTAFFATLSHEIRTPLNAVLGMTALTLATRLDGDQRSYLRSIRTNSEALLHLLSDILDFTKIESGKMELERMPFDVGAQIEEVAEVLAERAAAKNLELVVDIAPTLPARVLGDAHRTRQVLMNLLGNAIKYTVEGRVIVRAHAVAVDTEHVRARVEVEDTGIGMGPEARVRLFERFYRAREDATEGTGLGLTISRELATLMNGRIEVDSELGRGSTFTFEVTWPVALTQDPRHQELARTVEGHSVILAAPPGPATDALCEIMRTIGVPSIHRCDSRDLQDNLLMWPEALLIVDESLTEALPRPHRPAGVVVHTVARPLDSLPQSFEKVSKPVARHLLWEAIARAAGLAGQQEATWDLMEVGTQSAARILLVEDNADNQRVTAALLKRVGHEVVIASTGQAGIEAALRETFDLILLDIDLPDMSGLSVCEHLRAHAPDANVPIVAFTAHATEPMRRACDKAGMNGFLAKPVTARTLLDTASHWVRRAAPRILVVDDAPESRALLVHYLGELNLTAEQVDNGPQALQRAKEGELDLLIMDVEMPRMDGLEVLRQLRQAPRSQTLPVVLVTGHDHSHLLQRGLGEGPTTYVAKPVRRQPFRDAVQGFLTPRPAPPPAPLPQVDDAVRALLPAYAQRSLQALDAARRELIEGGCETAVRIGHQLKGTGGSYGLPPVTEVGAQLEDAARQGDTETALNRVGALRALLSPWAT